jgi:large subunit ribosomal protein L7Ae
MAPPQKKRVAVKKGAKKLSKKKDLPPVPGTEDKVGKKKEDDKKKKRPKNPLFERRPRRTRIGGHVHSRGDLTRFVRWPRYVKIQRQKKILYSRLKVPPAINQFTKSLHKNNALALFKLMLKYRPEEAAARKRRLWRLAAKKAKAQKGKESEVQPKTTEAKKRQTVKVGINRVTKLVEQKQAKLVVIAHDVDPIELVLWLPALCRKRDIPYCVIRGKSRLGQVVHMKTCAALCFTDVNKEDKSEFNNLAKICRDHFNNDAEARKHWGGGILGTKKLNQLNRKKRLAKKEEKEKEKMKV